MKRMHRRWHRLAWLLVTPAVVTVIGLALMLRTGLPVNMDWPAFLVAPAAVPAVAPAAAKGA